MYEETNASGGGERGLFVRTVAGGSSWSLPTRVGDRRDACVCVTHVFVNNYLGVMNNYT